MMATYKIMIVEDDPEIRSELSLLLENEMYHPFPVTDFRNIPEQAKQICPSLILLDINLPGQDGFSLCTALRRTISAPIIFVTSRDAGTDEVRALSLGGDDYITKPYSVPVLLARIKAALRRSDDTAERTGILEAAGLRLNVLNGTLMFAEKTVELTRNEMQILDCLMKNAGKIVSRADLIDTLWDNQIYIDDNTLSVNMTRIRGKLAALGLPDIIRTRRGMGYQL